MEEFDSGGILRLVCPSGWLQGVTIGDSIAVDGVCLTVTAIDGDSFTANLSAETISRCVPWVVAKAINLEQALSVGDKIGGHITSGHVDGVARIVTKKNDGNGGCIVRLLPPVELLPLLAAKSSVALAGVSLTVNRPDESAFEVDIIPYTLATTTIADWQAGDMVNIEVDMWARHVSHYIEMRDTTA